MTKIIKKSSKTRLTFDTLSIGKESYSVHGFIKYVLTAKIQAFKDGRKTEYTSRGTGQERHILPGKLLIL